MASALYFVLLLAVGCLQCGQTRHTTSENTKYIYADYGERYTEPVVVLGGIVLVHRSMDGECDDISNEYQTSEGIAYATGKINNDPYLLPGIKLGFEIRDSCTLVNTALEEVLHFISARIIPPDDKQTVYGVSGVIGASLSSASIAIANLLQLFDIPQISFYSTAQALSDKSQYEYFLRTIPPDSFQARTLADLVAYFDWTYVVAVNSDDVYGSEGIEEFIKILKSRNVTQRCIAERIEIPYPRKQATLLDYENAVDTIMKPYVSNATVIVLFGHTATAEGMLEAVDKRRKSDTEFAKRELIWIGTDSWGDSLSEKYLSIAQNLLSVIPMQNNSIGFDKYFQSLHIENYTSNPWFEEYWEYYFNCSLPNCDTNKTISPETGYRQHSVLSFEIDAVNAFAHAIHNLQQDKCNGTELCKAILVNDKGPMAINGELLLQYLRNVSFNGESTDLIDFDENGDQMGDYWIKNLQFNEEEETYNICNVAIWHSKLKTKPFTFFADVIWNKIRGKPQSDCSKPCMGGEYPELLQGQADCCWICKPCQGPMDVSNGSACTACGLGYAPDDKKTECVLLPVTYFNASNGWAIAALIITCFGILVTSFIIIVFLCYQKHKIIKASSRELSALLLTGILLCYIMPFFYIIVPSAPVCAIRRFGLCFCFALCFSALLVKTVRIYRIFNRRQISASAPPLISPLSQVSFTLLLVTVQVIIAGVWLVVEKTEAVYTYTVGSTDLKCGENPYIGLSVSLGYNLVLLLLATFFAFITRKIPKNFNETKCINVTAYTLVILWLAFIPTYFGTAALGAVYQTTSQVYAIVLSASTILGCLFVPKVYYLFLSVRGQINLTTTKPSSQIADLQLTSISQSKGMQPGLEKAKEKMTIKSSPHLSKQDQPASENHVHTTELSSQTKEE